MKNILLLFVSSCLLIGCSNEENDSVFEVESDRYLEMTEDDPSDNVTHFIHEFYEKTGVVIVKNPQPIDYEYNFSKSNQLEIIAPSQENEILQSGIDLLNEIAFNHYIKGDDYSFIKNNFPFTIQMGDTLKYTISPTRIHYYTTFCSSNLIAISRVNSDLKDKTNEEKRVFQAEFNSYLWQDLLVNIFEKYKPNPEIFKIGDEDIFDTKLKYQLSGDETWIESTGFINDYKEQLPKLYYSKGFLQAEYDFTAFKSARYPDLDNVIGDFMYGVFLLDHSELLKICDEYPLIKAKYDIIKEDLKNQFGFDIDSINNRS